MIASGFASKIQPKIEQPVRDTRPSSTTVAKIAHANPLLMLRKLISPKFFAALSTIQPANAAMFHI
jgi:hypothetical protein